MSESECFDLLDEPWLRVHTADGTLDELSLVDVFRRASGLAGLMGDVPTQVFALTRLLLAVLHSALRGRLDIDTWETMWRDKSLPVAEIEKYLDAHRHRFDLVHAETPFFQVTGLHTAKNEVSELIRLIADVPNGHPFFSTRMDRAITLSYAEAARWLVHCHAFDPSGIKSGAVDDPRVKGGRGYPIGTGWSGYLGGVLPEGTTLLETLLLNLIPHPAAQDLPVWERLPVGPASEERAPTGPVDLFTWQSRRVRLACADGRVSGVLICNGDRLTPQNRHDMENHTAWRHSPNQEKVLKSTIPVYMPLTHNPERAVWRGLQALLPHTSAAQGPEAPRRIAPGVMEWISKAINERIVDRHYPLRLRTIGMAYGNNNSVVDDVIDDAVSLQAILVDQGAEDLRQVALSCVDSADAAAYALAKLAGTLAEASGSREPAGHRARAIEIGYAALDPLFRRWLAVLSPESAPMTAKSEWHTIAHATIGRLGRQLVAESSPQAWSGRLVNKRWVTSTHADVWFRRDLNKALPLTERAHAKDIA